MPDESARPNFGGRYATKLTKGSFNRLIAVNLAPKRVLNLSQSLGLVNESKGFDERQGL